MATRFLDPVRSVLRDVVLAVNEILKGKTRNATAVTLRPNEATTTLTDSRIGTDSVLTFEPRTATAAAALAGLYVSARANGSATLTHANTAATDKTFGAVITG